MPTAQFEFFHSFIEAMGDGKFRLKVDQIKALLTAVEPDLAAASVRADLVEIAAGNGYAADGIDVTVTEAAQTLGNYRVAFAAFQLAASGGSSGPFRYLSFYDADAIDQDLIGRLDLGQAVTLMDGETLPFDDTAGAFAISPA